MLELLNLIPKQAYAALLAVALVFCGFTQLQLSGERAAHSETKATLATAEREAAEAMQVAEQVARAKESEVAALNTKLVEKTNEHLKDKNAAVARATAESSKLLDAAREVARKANESCSSASPGVNIQTTGSSADLLADVLGRINQRATELAAVADEARIRGLACEAQYNGVERVLNQEGASP